MRTGREAVKKARDQVLWRTPGLQGLVRAGARRGLLPPSLWRRLHPQGVWTLHAPDGRPFLYDSGHPRDRLARHIVWTDMRHWEASTQPVLYHLARNAEVFVDIGAYSGIYTLLACLADPGLRAVAVEPNPSKLEQIRSNIALNGFQDRVTLVGMALSSHPGTANLVIPTDDSQAALAGPAGPVGPVETAGISRTVRLPGTAGTAGTALPGAPGSPGEAAAQDARVVEVPVTTGDEILRDQPVDLIKMDAEGHEPVLLRGMATLLATRQPKIIAECLDQAALGEMLRVLGEYDYRNVYHLDEGGPVPVTDGSVRPRRSPNYLFSPEPVAFGEVTG